MLSPDSNTIPQFTWRKAGRAAWGTRKVQMCAQGDRPPSKLTLADRTNRISARTEKGFSLFQARSHQQAVVSFPGAVFFVCPYQNMTGYFTYLIIPAYSAYNVKAILFKLQPARPDNLLGNTIFTGQRSRTKGHVARFNGATWILVLVASPMSIIK